MSIVFPISGYIYYKTLSKVSNKMAKKMKKRVIFSSALISGPFIVRGIFYPIKILTSFDDKFATDSLKNDDFKFPLFMFVFYISVDILPMVFQMLSVKLVIDHYHQKVSFQNGNRVKSTHTDSSTGKKSVFKNNSLLNCDYSDTNDSFRDTISFESVAGSTKD